MKLSYKQLKNAIGLVTFLISYIVYYNTLAPTVNFIDSGELAAVGSTLGIAHPTGYPLFTLLGYLFSKLPLNWLIIKKLNLMSATFSSLGIFLFYHFLTLLITKLPNKNKIVKESYVYVVCATSALILGFSKTYWSQSTSIEVYSLHIFFISLILYYSLRIILSSNGNEGMSQFNLRIFLMLFFVLGLSFSNHMTTILLLPGVMYLIFLVFKLKDLRKKYLIHGFILFLIGVSNYLYLMIRASQEPFFNWGNPTNLERLFWHVSGKQYRVWIFSSFESARKQFEYYISNFNNEFNIIFIIIGILGAYHLFRFDKKLFTFFIILFFTCIGYSINYDIHDIDSYFLLSYFVFAIWVGVGLIYMLNKFRNKKLILSLISMLTLIPLILNYKQCDESKNFLVVDYMKNVFNSVADSSIIISYQWDYFISASYYYQEVENYRKDVIVIDKELLRRSWYFKQIKNNYPEIYLKSKQEIDLFLEELYKFEHNIPYNVQVIEKRYNDVIRSFIEKNYYERKIYVTPEIEHQYLVGYERIPAGLCYQLVKEKKDIVNKKVEFEFRSIEREDRLIEAMKKFYVRASMENGVYWMREGDIKTARRYFEIGLKISPDAKELRYHYNQIGL